jgi:hypothetical protein
MNIPELRLATLRLILRPSRRPTSTSGRALISLGLMISLVSLAGCPQPSAIGNACDPGVSSTGHDHEVTMTSPALECEGSICIQVGATPALCTAACGSDDDCRNLATSALCHAGFTCGVASAFGALGCRRVCVCRDVAAPTVSCPATP